MGLLAAIQSLINGTLSFSQSWIVTEEFSIKIKK
jgi:hypothetical protein